jgi:hypothetical protein
MALGLGNNLIRNGGSLNPDGLSLDLQFAADQTLTARKGPTPAFTRASTATYYGPSEINVVFTFDGTNFNVDVVQSTLFNGRYRWQNGDTGLSYTGTAWSLSQDGNNVATSAPASDAWRPDLADWSGTGAVVTATGAFGIVKAANNEPRFDHDPVTLACKGLLIEESRTNLILRSENFANASWVKSGGSISSVANVEPDGSANSELFSEDGTTGAHRIFQSFVGTIGTVYTLSVFLKFNGRAEVSLENRSITGNPTAIFNIQNGTIGFVSAGLTATIQAYPNGWYRCSITGTATMAGGNCLIAGYSVTGVYIGLNGPAFYIYGAQVEAGSFLTSYIPTVASSVVRSADVCSITGSAFSGFYNEFAGTVLCESTLNGVSPSVTPNTASFGGEQNGISMREYTGANSLNGIITSDENTTFNSSTGNVSSGVARKSAMAFQNEGSAILCLNGTLGTQDNSVVLPSDATGGQTPSTLILFRGQFTTVKSFRYFKKRLANAKLQTLTT